MTGAYYNENDGLKAAWLRELIRANVIARGEVDERSITEIRPEDLRGFKQCHFFAGIGVWSYSLRLAEWPDDRPVWTGSCPCPSFSCAGKGRGFDDPRHLWPAWSRLIGECQPATVFGEQADDAIGYGWLDLVQTDLEKASYSVGKAVLGACSVGAPHIRQRLYFAGHREHPAGNGLPRRTSGASLCARRTAPRSQEQRSSVTRDSSNSNGGFPGNGDLQRSGQQRLFAEDCGIGYGSNSQERRQPMRRSAPGIAGHPALANATRNGQQPISARLERHTGHERDGRGPGWLGADATRSVAATGATSGFWANCDWWYGRDGKYRPIEPGLFPLAHGAANRVLKLRGYGDAIVPQVAQAFIEAYMQTIDEQVS